MPVQGHRQRGAGGAGVLAADPCLRISSPGAGSRILEKRMDPRRDYCSLALCSGQKRQQVSWETGIEQEEALTPVSSLLPRALHSVCVKH